MQNCCLLHLMMLHMLWCSLYCVCQLKPTSFVWACLNYVSLIRSSLTSMDHVKFIWNHKVPNKNPDLSVFVMPNDVLHSSPSNKIIQLIQSVNIWSDATGNFTASHRFAAESLRLFTFKHLFSFQFKTCDLMLTYTEQNLLSKNSVSTRTTYLLYSIPIVFLCLI